MLVYIVVNHKVLVGIACVGKHNLLCSNDIALLSMLLYDICLGSKPIPSYQSQLLDICTL